VHGKKADYKKIKKVKYINHNLHLKKNNLPINKKKKKVNIFIKVMLKNNMNQSIRIITYNLLKKILLLKQIHF